MRRDPVPAVTLSEAAQTTVRMLIASYFIAAASGSIEGADMGALFAAVMPAPYGQILGGGIVLILSVMIMLDARTRLAALLLGLMTFYASYLHLMAQGVEEVLGLFWRDMALIAALMLTYGPDRERARERLGLHIEPHKIARSRARAIQTGATFVPVPHRAALPRSLRDYRADVPVENIFADEAGQPPRP